MTTSMRVLAGGVLSVLIALTAACSGGGDGALDAAAPAARDESAYGGGGGDVAAPSGDAGSDGAGANRTVVRVRSVIRTGEVAVTREDLDAARAEVDELLAALDGVVDNEQTQYDDDGEIERATLVVRVPVDKFRVAMNGLQGLGTMKHSDSRSKNVTTEVIDVDERVQTLVNSLDRLQAFQREATDIDDLIRFEQQITQRESELQSLKAQQAYLADQTSMSTITLFLSTPKEYVEPPGALDEAGFLAGLKAGWDALTDSVVVVLTVAGAVLPFLGVLLLAGVPLWLLIRRTRTPTPVPPAD